LGKGTDGQKGGSVREKSDFFGGSLNSGGEEKEKGSKKDEIDKIGIVDHEYQYLHI